METKNGGSAFLCSAFNDGMSLRDYFAASALQGFLSAGTTINYLEIAVVRAYKYADAMLLERVK